MHGTYVALNLHYLHALAALYRYGGPDLSGCGTLTKHPLFDFRAVVCDVGWHSYTSRPVKVFTGRTLADLYLSKDEQSAVDLVPLSSVGNDPTEIDVAIAFDVAANALPAYDVSTVMLGVGPGAFPHVVAELGRAGKRIAFLDFEAVPGPPFNFTGGGDTHLVPEYVWRQPFDLPDSHAVDADELEDGAFILTPLRK